MSTTITIPHQRITFDSGEEGTIRGSLVSRSNGIAHGHLSIASQSGARRYHAVSGSLEGEGNFSVQLEEVRTGSGTIELVSLDVRLSDDPRGRAIDADVTLNRLPDGAKILRATIRIAIEDS